jgi:ribosomal protein L13
LKRKVLIVAEGKVLGRLATEISMILRGKNNPASLPIWIWGDNVIVINAEKIVLTGKKSRVRNTSSIRNNPAVRGSSISRNIFPNSLSLSSQTL